MLSSVASATVELGRLDVSIQTFEEAGWETSATGAVLRRVALLLALVGVLCGPFVAGGTLGWMMTQEPGLVLGDDGWLRSAPATVGAQAGVPLVSFAELTAAGVSVADAEKILRR